MEQPVMLPEEQEETLSRRRLLKALAASGSAVAAAAFLPGKWVKPVVEVGVLPAHAQVTPVAGDLEAVLIWEAEYADYELHVIDPADGQDVFVNGFTLSLTHSGNAAAGSTGSESANNTIPGVVVAGTYQIYVRSAIHMGGAGVAVDVTVNGATTSFDLSAQFTADGQARRVADVSFPDGTVTDRVGESYP